MRQAKELHLDGCSHARAAGTQHEPHSGQKHETGVTAASWSARGGAALSPPSAGTAGQARHRVSAAPRCHSCAWVFLARSQLPSVPYTSHTDRVLDGEDSPEPAEG